MPTTQVPQLDSDTVAVLREVAEWWRKKKEAGMLESDLSLEPRTLEPSYRPHFPGPRRNTGVRLHERLLRDALAKAKTEETKIGKGLSPLIEHLFWAYLNFDPKYLQAKTDDDKEETPPSPVQPEAGPQ